MANPEHLGKLVEGVAAWNKWMTAKLAEPGRGDKLIADLSSTDLSHFVRPGLDLRWCDLSGATVSGERSHCNLAHSRLSNANLSRAKFIRADLHGASLRKAIAHEAVFRECNLRHANLTRLKTESAQFINCEVFGASFWGTEGKPKLVRLRISPHKPGTNDYASTCLVADDLESAPFLHLLADNTRITSAFDHLNRRLVLMLGRFSGKHHARLDAMRKLIKRSDLVPVVFDFDQQEGRSLTETIGALAHLSYFVIADLTEAKSVPQELSHIVPFLPSVPVVPLASKREEVYPMFEHFLRYPWVLDLVEYGADFARFEPCFEARVVGPAEGLAKELRRRAQTRLSPR